MPNTHQIGTRRRLDLAHDAESLVHHHASVCSSALGPPPIAGTMPLIARVDITVSGRWWRCSCMAVVGTSVTCRDDPYEHSETARGRTRGADVLAVGVYNMLVCGGRFSGGETLGQVGQGEGVAVVQPGV